MKSKTDTKRLVGLGLFTAIVVILQMLGSFIRFGTFSVSLVLIPIAVGAAFYGTAAGMWLGFVFGAVVLLSGDASLFLAVNPLGTLFTVLVKGIFAGLAAGLCFRLLRGRGETVATLVASFACPVVNTGIFLLCCRLFFFDTVAVWAEEMGFGANVTAYLFLSLAGGNFLFELLFNMALCPIILRLLSAEKHR